MQVFTHGIPPMVQVNEYIKGNYKKVYIYKNGQDHIICTLSLNIIHRDHCVTFTKYSSGSTMNTRLIIS